MVGLFMLGLNSLRAEDPAWVNRETLRRELASLGAIAQRFFHLPVHKGGGGGAFDGSQGGAPLLFSDLTSRGVSFGGVVIIGSVSAYSVVLNAVGRATGDDRCLLSLTAYVFPDSVYVQYNN